MNHEHSFILIELYVRSSLSIDGLKHNNSHKLVNNSLLSVWVLVVLLIIISQKFECVSYYSTADENTIHTYRLTKEGKI
jgi:hypothetical protein